MSLPDVGVPGRQIDVIDGGDVDPNGPLLSVAEIQQAFLELRRRRSQPAAAQPHPSPQARAAQRPHTSASPARTGPHTSVDSDVDRPHTPTGLLSPQAAQGRPHASDAALGGERADRCDPAAFGADWVAVVSAHSGAGASCVAVALADALADAGRACRLVETAHPARSGLLAAAAAELGTDPTGAWRRGSRRLTTLYRRACDTAPRGWPDPIVDAATVVDLGLPAPANVARLVADQPCIVLVCRVTVPGLRLAEQLLAELEGSSIVLAAVGPGRWPGEVLASLGPRVRALRAGRQVVTVPDHRRLQVSGPTTSPLPKSVSHAGRELLGLIGAARPGGAGAPATQSARSTPRTKGSHPMSSVLAATLNGHLFAAGVCPKAPPGVQKWDNQVLSWVKWGVLAVLAISFFVSVGMLIWGRVTHHPKGARLGFDGLMICLVGAIVYVVGYVIITSITGNGC